ncbi:MAG: polysaccharide biosynthesis protein [Bacteroidota bacterium]|nr:polysaccharide biosynthesis protein [Flavisolibacter sp.]MBD0298623.1 polysaccharide biosynthesis protein [Flavisolibacter sp.]MBD0350836.1 polysaccharide biosynthesis protein [Flavisolibacter sp.]MDQ3842637.1 polysaccharide biosynthesis protein [Bacteroidota bacterium]
MRKKLFNYRTVPRWVILLIDLIIISWSFAFSYFILKQFEFNEVTRGNFFLFTGSYCSISFTVFYFMRIHTGLIRYSNMQDVLRIFSAVLISSLIYPIVVKLIIVPNFSVQQIDLFKTLLINFFISSSLLIMLRTAVKESFHYVKRITLLSREKALIYGSDSNAILIKQALESGNDALLILGFVENNRHKVNSYIEQKKVYHIKELQQLKNKHNVNKLVLLNEDLGSVEKKLVINECLRFGIKVVTVPPSNQWVQGKLSLNQVMDLKIEDLLQREPININNHLISDELKNKRILITGAAGSIGSEIVRQVLKFGPEMVILCDQAESALHEMQLEVEDKFPDANIKIFIGNIQNSKRMEFLFSEYQPQIVFHAAAYKHVPLMENNPCEAILTNVKGSKNMADLALKYKIEKFVMISTDKAVKPTNVMGASKRIAEIYIQSLNNWQDDFFNHHSNQNEKNAPLFKVENKTKFITTRFGNVLDSNGSVIPRFRAQIKKGGPITVTDPEITRYFMTIPEAVQLVLEAGTMGKGGEIYVFDMGKPVRIVHLAHQMIKLAGLVPDKDIKIVYTGLRPGEKLYEELLNEKETTLPTHHEKIKIAKVVTYSYEQVSHDIDDLILMSHHEVNEIIVRKMKDIVPEFISNNSEYEKLDKIKLNKTTSETEKSFNIASI